MSERKYTIREESMRGVVGWLNTHGYEYRDGETPTRIVIEREEEPKCCVCGHQPAPMKMREGEHYCKVCWVLPVQSADPSIEKRCRQVVRSIRSRGFLRKGL